MFGFVNGKQETRKHDTSNLLENDIFFYSVGQRNTVYMRDNRLFGKKKSKLSESSRKSSMAVPKLFLLAQKAFELRTNRPFAGGRNFTIIPLFELHNLFCFFP